MGQSGRCMCGEITFEIASEAKNSGACHCDMCRHWSGGIYVAVEVPAGGVTVTSAKQPTVFKSSDWAERTFCSTCGSSLWYRVTAPGPHHGVSHLGLGTLDEPSGFPLTEELFSDRRPDGFHFGQKTKEITAAEVFAMFGGG